MSISSNLNQLKIGLGEFSNLTQIKHAVFFELYKSPASKEQLYIKINASKLNIKKAIRALIYEEYVTHIHKSLSIDICNSSRVHYYTSNTK